MVNIEKIGDKAPESDLMMSEIASVLYKERDVLEKAGSPGNQSKKLAAAGMVMLSLLACEGCITGPQTRDILGNLAREMSNAAFDGVRQQTQLGAEAVRTRLHLDEQRVRNFNDEIRAAKTDDEVAFVKRKYGMTGR